MAFDLDLDLDPDTTLHTIGDGAVLAASVTIVRLGLDFLIQRAGRRMDRQERERAFQRDAEARLERVLQDRLSEADRRLDRCEFEIGAERARRTALQEQYSVLRTDYTLLLTQHRLLVEEVQRAAGEVGDAPRQMEVTLKPADQAEPKAMKKPQRPRGALPR